MPEEAHYIVKQREEKNKDTEEIIQRHITQIKIYIAKIEEHIQTLEFLLDFRFKE